MSKLILWLTSNYQGSIFFASRKYMFFCAVHFSSAYQLFLSILSIFSALATHFCLWMQIPHLLLLGVSQSLTPGLGSQLLFWLVCSFFASIIRFFLFSLSSSPSHFLLLHELPKVIPTSLEWGLALTTLTCPPQKSKPMHRRSHTPLSSYFLLLSWGVCVGDIIVLNEGDKWHWQTGQIGFRDCIKTDLQV